MGNCGKCLKFHTEHILCFLALTFVLMINDWQERSLSTTKKKNCLIQQKKYF